MSPKLPYVHLCNCSNPMCYIAASNHTSYIQIRIDKQTCATQARCMLWGDKAQHVCSITAVLSFPSKEACPPEMPQGFPIFTAYSKEMPLRKECLFSLPKRSAFHPNNSPTRFLRRFFSAHRFSRSRCQRVAVTGLTRISGGAKDTLGRWSFRGAKLLGPCGSNLVSQTSPNHVATMLRLIINAAKELGDGPRQTNGNVLYLCLL